MSKITLISYTKDAQKLVATAAKLCYSTGDICEQIDSLTPLQIEKFIDMLMEIGHESPIEHVSFTFLLEGVSRALLAQITRHRIASYSVQSQRYVNGSNFSFVVPPAIEEIPEANRQFIDAMHDDFRRYEDMVELLKSHYFEKFIAQAKCDREATKLSEKKAIEDARFLLPNACTTNIMCTFNARSLFNFFAHRCCNRAQWEIRQVATEMLRLVNGVAPVLFKSAGPKCLKGPCPEGKMCCGQTASVRKFFEGIKVDEHETR